MSQCLRGWKGVFLVALFSATFVGAQVGLIGLTALAQSPGAAPNRATDSAATKLPVWDVVSVKPLDAQDPCANGGGRQTTHDGIHIFCVPVMVAIEMGYDIMDLSRIVGAPEWAKSGLRWNIDAKVAGEDAAMFGKLPDKVKDQMLQTLLVDRFHLKAHMEKREMPVYDLVVAKGGSKLKDATAEEAARGSMVMHGPGKVECMGEQLTSLPWLLTRETGRPTVDKTGLTGKYDFTLEFVPAAKAATDETGGASIFTAIEEQLGLKLEPAKEPMEVLVIDSIEQPAAN